MCQQLKLARAQSPKKLIKMAFQTLPLRDLQAVFGTKYPRRGRILLEQRRRKMSLHRLAETLYYHRGAQLSRRARWNDMTILQMQHELQKRDKLDESEYQTLSEWKLRLRLACVVKAENEAWKEGVKVREEKRVEARRAWAAQLAAYDQIDRERSEDAEMEQEQQAVC
ncbi:hypothetical protein G6011_11575 [Alternaria panax]|uniref:Uncharacterized protein n=1 Tax=Alternaria panax TaxID=48097 RepID=A0AAD4IEA3_9PLEO|nr:hypothetical protein G6011_11575 [Alternaria panax]